MSRRGAARWLAALLVLAAACVRARPLPPVLRVGTTGDYPPFSVERDGAFSGLDIDVALRFAAASRLRLEIVRVRWPELTRDLAAGRFDLAIGGVTMRPERAVVGTFSRPIARTGAMVLARGAPDGAAPDLDRPGLRLAVNAGGHLERVAARLFPQAVLVRTTENRALPAYLSSGTADAILTDDVEADVFATDVPDAVRVGPFTQDRKAFLGRDPALVARLDEWLRAREEDGTLALLRARWLGPSHEGPSSLLASDVEALLALIDLRLAFMPAVAAAKQRAGRPIRDTAQEARVLEAARTSALEHGLAADAADALFGALVDGARDVQAAFVERPWTVESLDLEREARPAIARLSGPIVARAADVARDPPLAALDRGEIAAALDGSLAPAHARRAIARAIVGLRPAVPDAPAAATSSSAPPPTASPRRRTRAGRKHRSRPHRHRKAPATTTRSPDATVGGAPAGGRDGDFR